ncbi:MAG TPA: PIG-L deacetylase family protein [Candidatus Saccharimonadales bacterium]|nr:PIG-L deacetylase family protein [Candidatus Saccharimonadales bacterium]
MQQQFTPLQPKIVLGIAAHPDDLDFCAGGTMAAFAAQGAEVYYLILTDGSRGSEDRAMTADRLRDIRREEQRNAAKILGAKDVFFRDYTDGTLENTQDVKRDVVQVIRKVKPDVVITLDPTFIYSAKNNSINHPDHRAAGQAALDALFPLARDHMAFPELLAQGYEPHKTPHVLLTCFSNEDTTFSVDITSTYDLKLQAIAAHASQYTNESNLRALVQQLAEEAGKTCGTQYAEAFVRLDIQ